MSSSLQLAAATAILALTYAAIVREAVNRAVAALLGAAVLLLLGILSQNEAVGFIDFNTLGLLAGMMIVVAVARKSGLFSYCAVRAAQLARASPAGILAALALITALLSAGLNNVTTVLLVAPVTFIVCKELELSAYPFLFAEILASNIGGTATLIGDPPNILIGSAAHLNFDDFLFGIGPVVAVIMALQLLASHLIWGVHLKADPAHRARVMSLNARGAISDPYLLRCSLWVIGGALLAFMLAARWHLEAATIALGAAALLLLLDNLRRPLERQNDAVAEAMSEVDWTTLFFFVGLFVVVGGVEKVGLLALLAHSLAHLVHGSSPLAAGAILWVSALLSAVLDNIPFVATMIPVVKAMAPSLGGPEALRPVWWALALGACLGGNGTLVGASANLAVAGIAAKNGVPFRFFEFMKLAFPMMLASVALAQLYLWWRYF
jgi:Na+/H+ antiporter NhaD/arsenite permease-like protein